MADRHNSMDTLRFLATFLVILVHYASWFSVINPIVSPMSFWAGNIYNSFGRVCVPLFVMISGNFLLNDNIGMSFQDFYRKRVNRIISPFIFWVIFYTIYLIIEMASRDGGDYSVIIMNIFTGEKTLHLWYLYMLIGLYFVTPAIASFKKNCTDKEFLMAGILFLIIGLANQLWREVNKSSSLWLVWFVDYIGFYMLGAALATMRFYLNKYWFLSFYILVCIATAIINHVFKTIGVTTYALHSSLSLPTALETLSLYSFFALSDIKANIFSKLAPYTFGIYLVHAIIVSLVFRNLKALMQSAPLITIPVASVLTIGLSLAITYLLTLNRYTKKVV